ncbi:hypothetical protein RND81_13G047200 [Saponaria officinalis]|uniref:Glycosyltransferase n=1 Tax=Saponaria officinalis TaxID=3572 RepID=A0AAW1H0H6_SAPOF
MGSEETIQSHNNNNKVTQVILLPFPLQGPVNCFLKLAYLLSTTSDISVTFFTAAFIHRRLPHLPSLLPTVRFVVGSDGIAGDHRRPPAQFLDMARNFEAEFVSRLPELQAAEATCVIADGVFTGAGKAAMEVGIAVVYFSTLSPCCIWASCALVPKLVDDGVVPFVDGDLDDPVTNIPGSESILRRRDLPGICRAKDMSEPYIELILRECRELPTAQAHILNTCDKLEGTALLSELRSLFPNLYTIGPIHALAKTRMRQQNSARKLEQCGSFWEEDWTCLTWLDSQPPRSVGVRFLWVQRLVDGSGVGSLDDDVGFQGRMHERGRVVTWAPQEEDLDHRAVGGFLTHSGWNSTLESVVEGVPMICWPNGIDQLVICRFVEEVWKIGVDMKDRCDRVEIERMVKDVMEKRRGEFRKKANEVAKLANEAVMEGGSSWCALDRLIEDIKFMRFNVPH